MGAARGKTAGGASTAGSGRHLGVCCSTVASVVLERGSRRLSPVSQGPLQNFLGNVVFHESRVRCLLVLFKARPLRPGSPFPCSSYQVCGYAYTPLQSDSTLQRSTTFMERHSQEPKTASPATQSRKERASGHDDRRFVVWGLWVWLLRRTQFRHSSKGSVAVIIALFNFVRVRVNHTLAHRCKYARIPSKFCLDIACSCALS